MKLNIVGNIFDSSGYSSHTRQLANALFDEGNEVRIDCQKPENWQRFVNDAELSMLNTTFDEEFTTIMIATPPFWRIGIADNPKNFIGYLVWEGDRIPFYWLKYLMNKNVKQVWVPSEHTKNAVLNTDPDINHYFEKKIRVVPHGVDLSIFQPKDVERDNKFTFLINKGWRGGMSDRGGVQYAIKAFAEEFSKDEDVKMIVKLNPAYLGPNFNFQEEVKKLGVDIENCPTLLLNTDNVEYSSLVDLYNQADVLVNSCRAEGFGLTGLEAHACGLPTIQTDFGGQLDYMDGDYDYFVFYDLEEVTDDILYEGVRWATPQLKNLKLWMREAYKFRKTIEGKKDKIVKDTSVKTWRNAAKLAKEYLRELK